MKAEQILNAAEQNNSIYSFSRNIGYEVRTVQLYVKRYFRHTTYKRISTDYKIAKTILLIEKGYSIQYAWLAVTGSYNTSSYYNRIKEVKANTNFGKKRFLKALAVINKIACAATPVTLKQLGCRRSLIAYIRHTLGYSILSKSRAGYYFSSESSDRSNCERWINAWRRAMGMGTAYRL